MKKLFALAIAVAAMVAAADIYRNGTVRGVRFPDMKLRLHENDRHGWEVSEDAPLFCAHFATVNYAEYHFNYAEQKELAIEVARAIASYLGSTNSIRVVHWEQQKPASTNVIDQIMAKLSGKYVTDEVIPLVERKE